MEQKHQMLEVRVLQGQGYMQEQIAKMLEVTDRTVRNILKGKSRVSEQPILGGARGRRFKSGQPDFSSYSSIQTRGSQPYVGAQPGALIGWFAASSSSCSVSIRSLTETMSFSRNAFAPAKAKPFLSFPFFAFIRASAMQ